MYEAIVKGHKERPKGSSFTPLAKIDSTINGKLELIIF